MRTYDKNMEEGLNAKLEAQARAAQTGVGVVARTIAPHGNAKDRLEVVEQAMMSLGPLPPVSPSEICGWEFWLYSWTVAPIARSTLRPL
jgi:hypothetical protein